jgi:predicted transport protein
MLMEDLCWEHAPGDVEFTINNKADIPYLIELARQAYERN